MDTDPGLAALHVSDGRRVIDFGRARIVDRERHGVRDRKVISPAFRRLREGIREASALREILGVERHRYKNGDAIAFSSRRSLSGVMRRSAAASESAFHSMLFLSA